MLAAVKRALHLSTDAYDEEIQELIQAALADLRVTAGVTTETENDPLVIMAVKTYCRAHFGSPDDYAQLATSYESQKGALRIATGYTDWGDQDGHG